MISPAIINAVIRQESGGNPRAVSPAGAAGLMQIMPATARDPGFGIKPMDWSKRFDPQENVRFGIDYLEAMLGRYKGDLQRALVAYNAGPGTADKWNGQIGSLPKETQGYVRKITGNLAKQGGAKIKPGTGAPRIDGGQDGQPSRTPPDLRFAQNSMQMNDASPAMPKLRPVSDPDIIRALDGMRQGGQAPQQPAGRLRRVSDPDLIRALEGMRQGGQAPTAPGVEPPAPEAADGPQAGQVLPPGGDTMPILQRSMPGVTAVARTLLPEQAQQNLEGLGKSLVEGGTGTWSAEMQGWLSAAPAEGARLLKEMFGIEVGPSTYNQDYDRARIGANVEQSEIDRQVPVGSTAAKIVGGLGTAAAVPSATGLAANTAGKVGLGALEGAALGAGVAAGSADPGQRLDAAVPGAVGGALAGGAGARLGVGLERYLALRAARKAAPSSAGLKETSQELYKAAADAGVVYKPQTVDDLVQDVSARMAGELIDPTLHPNASAVVKRLPELLEKPATLKELERYRQLASDAAREAKPGSRDERLASMLVDALDEFTLDDSNMVVTSGAAGMQQEARNLWHRYRKDQLVQFEVEKAMRRAASTGSGGNTNNAIRTNLRKILDNKKLRRGFTADEIKALETIVDGGSFDNLLRLGGKLSPSGNGLMLFLQGTAGVASGGMTVPLAVAGAGAKNLADNATTRRVAALAAMIRSGGKPPFGMIAALSLPERRALARLTAAAAGQDIGEGVTGAVRSAAGRDRAR